MFWDLPCDCQARCHTQFDMKQKCTATSIFTRTSILLCKLEMNVWLDIIHLMAEDSLL
jgi:hypothetical protein